MSDNRIQVAWGGVLFWRTL